MHTKNKIVILYILVEKSK